MNESINGSSTAGETLRLNQKGIEAFLGHFPGHLIQTFDDSGNNGKLAQIFNYDINRIEELQKQGAGIFLTVNPTTNGKRNIKNLKYISALMLDLDVAKEKDVLDAAEISARKKKILAAIINSGIPEQPHFINDTKNGFHVIWLFAPFIGYKNPDHANIMYKGLVEALGQKIGKLSEGDSAVRVFRLPFCLHQKAFNKPYEVKILVDNSHLPRYNFKEMLDKYGVHVEAQNNADKTKKRAPNKFKAGLTEENIPIEQVIQDAATEMGIKVTFKEQANGTKQIIENDEETSGFISETGEFCYSMSGKERKGSNIGVVKYYLKCSRQRAMKWLHTKYKMNFQIKPSQLARAILQEKKIGQLSKAYYMPEKTVWSEVDEEKVRLDIIKAMEDIGYDHNQSKINEVQNYLDDFAYGTHGQYLQKSIKAKSRRDEIAFSNGILDCNTWALRTLKDEDYMITKIPHPYIQKQYECPLWLQFIDDVFKGEIYKIDMISFLQEWMGLSLIHDTSQEKCLIFLGSGANGKSVFLHIWRKVVGEENCSAIDLSDISNEQYTVQLLGKNINTAADIRTDTHLDTGILKKIVSGDTITGKSVYQKPIEFACTARLIFAANNLPMLRDGGESIRRRLHIVPFNQTFSGKNIDRNLKAKLEKEVGEIMLWAIEGLKRLRERGHFDTPKIVEKAVEVYLQESDNVGLFLEDNYEIIKSDTMASVERSRLYDEYKEYCRDNGYQPHSNKKVYEKLRSLGVSEKKTSGIRYLIGLKQLTADDNPQIEL